MCTIYFIFAKPKEILKHDISCASTGWKPVPPIILWFMDNFLGENLSRPKLIYTRCSGSNKEKLRKYAGRVGGGSGSGCSISPQRHKDTKNHKEMFFLGASLCLPVFVVNIFL
jgi:hypothetical protein